MTVTCSDIQSLLARGELPESADQTAHAASCALCSELLADQAALGRALAESAAPSPSPALDQLRASVTEAVEADRGALARLRSMRTHVRSLLAVAAAAVVSVGTLLAAPRADLAVYPALRMTLVLVSLALALLGVTWVALRPLQRSPLPVWLVIALGTLAAGLPWVLALLPVAHVGHPAALQGGGGDFARWALACLSVGSLLGVPVLLALRALDRGAHAGRARALLAAAAAGLVGNLALQLHCPVTAPAHLLLGHASVLVLFLLVYGGLQALRRS